MNESTWTSPSQRSHIFNVDIEDTLEALHLSMSLEGTCHCLTALGNSLFL